MAGSLPLVYACSGCSLAGRLAYDLALELERRGIAEMSCLVGVGASKPHFLRQLRKREVWVIDGCPIECGLGVFEQIRHLVDVHIRLHDFGVRKTSGAPNGLDVDRMIDAALEQVSAQRSLKRQQLGTIETVHSLEPPANKAKFVENHSEQAAMIEIA